jgi:3-hydroxy-D-aspartate aldolase
MTINRRAFLAAGAPLVAAPLLGHWGEGRAFAAVALPESTELRKAVIPTPALVLDLDRFENNLKVVADHCRRTGCNYRPHAKTHKCPEIARRQVAAGALGVCAATVPEAEAMVAAGIPGVLLTSPIVEPAKISRMVALAKSGRDVMLAVGDPLEVQRLAEAAEAAQTTVNVLVDLDVGDHRTGITPGERAVELARTIDRAKSLRLRGIQAYAGFASHVNGFDARQSASRDAMAKAVETRDRFAKAGLDDTILSGGSTGTYNIDSNIDGVTELQVGSYVFMDVGYRSIGSRDGNETYSDFQPSLTVLTTVVATTGSDHVTIDAGIKAFATDSRRAPQAKDRSGLTYRRFGDEFGAVSAEPGADLPRLGERLEFIIPHCDPTVNLYDRLYALRGELVEAIWPIAARRERQA